MTSPDACEPPRLPESIVIDERLEGDALYFWAKKIAEIEFAQKALREFGESELRRRNLGDDYVITNDGYITRRP